MSSKKKTERGQAKSEGGPKLRFPEFRDAGEWEEKRIEDLAIRGSGHTPNKSQPSYYNGGIKWVSLADSSSLDNGYIYETKIKISKEGLENSSAVLHPPGTVIISRDAGIGKSAVLYSAMAVSQHFIVWRCNQSKLSNWFLYFFLQVLKPKLEEIATGSTIKTIGLPYFKELCIPIPSIHEQQQIADCLSSIDDRITAETQKLDTLKAHKKGLMQQLFPAEGETLPKLRFPEFRDAGEWGCKIVKEVFTIFQGYAFSSNDGVEHGVRWIKIADVGIHKMELGSPSYLPYEFSEKYQKFSIKKGDCVLALTRPILNKKLKIARANSLYDGALLNQRVGKLVTTQNIDFIYFLLQTEYLVNEIEKNISGSEPPNLSAHQIEDISVCIPLETEQQKIATCLSSLDELITTQTQKIDTLKTHKKGLMQQLFPALEEVKK